MLLWFEFFSKENYKPSSIPVFIKGLNKGPFFMYKAEKGIILRREFEIAGQCIYSLEDFHHEISRLLSFPSYYDNSMDALWDCLTSYIDPNITLYWVNHTQSQRSMGHDFQRIIDILNSTKLEHPEFEFFLN